MSNCHPPSWKTLVAAVVSLLPLPAFGQQAALNSGTVTLPYDEWKTLWEAAQPKPAPPAPAKPPSPPVAYSAQSARYEINLGPGSKQATGKAVIEIANFAEGWTAVPLFLAKEIRLAGVEPAGTLVTVRDGVYTLLLDSPGRRVITLRFSADLANGGSSARTRVLRLSGPSALVNELTVSGVPDGWVAEVQNASPQSTLFELAADQPILLTLVSAQDRQQPPPPPTASLWHAQSQSLVHYDEGQLVYHTSLRLDADSGTGLSATLALPAAANILAVTGPDLDQWAPVKLPAADARQIQVAWKTPDVLRRVLSLEYELPQASPEGDWHLISPRAVSAGSDLRDALYALPLIDDMEFVSAGEGGAALTAGSAQELPHWLAQSLAGVAFVSVQSTQPATLVRARRLPLIHTARATVEESRFHTRLVADGALLCDGAMTLRHDGPVTLTLTLPKDAQLLSCAVSGHDALPVDRGQGRIDLNLPGGDAGQRTQVSLSYTSHLPALAPVAGQIALSLPETGLFVQTLYWDLQIPDEYELTAIEGNVSLTPGSGPPMIHLRKDLLNSEQPAVELFYQKRSVAP
jgi:hypothetical protein